MTPLLTLLNSKFHGISTQHDVSQLYSIARFAEKYDATHLLVPYMEKWCVLSCGTLDGCPETDIV